jgi:AcrR family transcriptional regulator
MNPSQPGASPEVKPDRRQELILAAFHIIAEKGFEGLRVRNVAAQVGINGATLHHYFPTKEDLIQAVVEYTITRLRSLMESLALAGSPAEKIHTHLTRLYQLMREEPSIFVVLIEISMRAQHQSMMKFIIQQHAVWQGLLAGILREGIEEQIWPSDLDPEAVAATIITLMEGASLWAVTYPQHGEQVLTQLEKWLRIA